MSKVEEARLKKSRQPIIAGGLVFIQGVFWGITPVVALIMLQLQPFDPQMTSAVGHAFLFIMPLVIVGVPAGILAMIGGICAIRRSKFGLALIASFFPAVPSTIFLAMSMGSLIEAFRFQYYNSAHFTVLGLFVMAILGIILTLVSEKHFITKSASESPETV